MTDSSQATPGATPLRLFGVPTLLGGTDAASLLTALEGILDVQLSTLPPSARRRRDAEGLAADLDALRHWFDPVSKGERIRDALAALPRVRIHVPHVADEIVMTIPYAAGEVREPGSRMLLTPEGVVVLYCLRDAQTRARLAGALPGDPVRFNGTYISDALVTLAATYRSWIRQRIDQVITLLTSEPSTLRPAAAGLLLVLLVNRNTSPDRALPRPSDRQQLDTISAAIAAPALAYARTLTGSDRASLTGVDLYRGWALGELTRRLGPALHTGLDEGIYLDPSAEGDALRRLADDIARRPPAARARAKAAVDATLREYASARPVLAGLALAHDRPSNTQRIREALVAAAKAEQLEPGP